MSQLGQKRKLRPAIVTSALPSRADMRQRRRHVSQVPTADMCSPPKSGLVNYWPCSGRSQCSFRSAANLPHSQPRPQPQRFRSSQYLPMIRFNAAWLRASTAASRRVQWRFECDGCNKTARRANQRQLVLLLCPARSQKIFLFFRSQITSIDIAIPSRTRGVSRDRHGRRYGMRWTRQRRVPANRRAGFP
jgi:hypothetical protein